MSEKQDIILIFDDLKEMLNIFENYCEDYGPDFSKAKAKAIEINEQISDLKNLILGSLERYNKKRI
ncbi:MAG: hypothetical protein AABY22_13545 [Nanoarchaeota archaeon]